MAGVLNLGNPHHDEGGRFASISGDKASLQIVQHMKSLFGDNVSASFSVTHVGDHLVEAVFKGREHDVDEPDFALSFNKEEGAYLNYFYVPPAMQGKGYATSVMRQTVDSLQSAGVKKISLEASDAAGAYVWARLGFSAENPEDLAHDLLKKLGTPKTEEDRSLWKLVKSNASSPHLNWYVADFGAAGKALLRDTDYEGVLNFNDTAGMARFNHYVRHK